MIVLKFSANTLAKLLCISLYTSFCICVFGCNEPLACHDKFLDESKYDDYLGCESLCMLKPKPNGGMIWHENVEMICAITEADGCNMVRTVALEVGGEPYKPSESCIKMCKRANCDVAHDSFGKLNNESIESIKAEISAKEISA